MNKIRRLLYPFSLLYSGIMQIRNRLYDEQIFTSRKFEFPVIGVGNLSMGGTGKSPMIEYLIRLLERDYRVATLSRGYKRSSKGFRLLKGSETAAEVGDEPLQFKRKFPQVAVAVDENRVHGIEKLLKLQPSPQVILLDDAFQHRKVQAGLYILLTSFERLYSDDLVLPAGDLREPRTGAQRADLVVVTKCPADISEKQKQEIISKLRLHPKQEIFFSGISYSREVINDHEKIGLDRLEGFTLVTGIAKPAPLVAHLRQQDLHFEHLSFPDHHNFSASEIAELKHHDKIITTEKDYMRLKEHFPSGKLFYLPIEICILGNPEKFKQSVQNFVLRNLGNQEKL